MTSAITRKEFLAKTARTAAAIAAGSAGATLLHRTPGAAAPSSVPWPWPYSTLDVEEMRIAGHDAFWIGKGCSYASFYALADGMAKLIGEPYTSFPSEIMIYGHGGGAGWGVLCGTLNGAAAFISLVCTKERSDVLVSELLGWYTQTIFPTDQSNAIAAAAGYGTNKINEALPQSLSGSVLCHASVTSWLEISGSNVGALERKERCARLTGDIAAYAAQILNDDFAGTFAPLYVPPETIAACMTCHGTAMINNVISKMECQQCHGDPHAVSSVETLSSEPETYNLSQNYPNPFNPSTTIRFSLPAAQKVSLSVYDVHGRLIRTLIDHQQHSAGTYSVTWDGITDAGSRAASGVYFTRINAGTFSATKKMSLVK